jgi:uncharacterized OsmC-like protein
MNAEQLRSLQAPLKERYRQDPSAARQTLVARGLLESSGVACRIESSFAPVEAGLHPATGGDGTQACSANMLLEALVGCAGVTLRAVATALGIPVRGGSVTAEGDLDFRGTLGVAKDVPVGLTAVRLAFHLDTEAPKEQLDKLIQLTERYCVVFQTLRTPPAVTATWSRQ